MRRRERIGMPAKRKHIEHGIQVAFMELALVWFRGIGKPHLEGLLFAIPNGAHLPRRWIGGKYVCTEGVRLRAEGMKRGVPDVFYAFPNSEAAGLFLEFKSKTGTVSFDQKYMMQLLTEAGYRCEVVRSVEEAIDVLIRHSLKDSEMTEKEVEKIIFSLVGVKDVPKNARGFKKFQIKRSPKN